MPTFKFGSFRGAWGISGALRKLFGRPRGISGFLQGGLGCPREASGGCRVLSGRSQGALGWPGGCSGHPLGIRWKVQGGPEMLQRMF